MPDHVEEREFNLRLVFRCTFGPDYDGDLDGFAWGEEANAISAAAVRGAAAAIRAHKSWSVVAGNRGRAAEDEVTLEISKRLDAAT